MANQELKDNIVSWLTLDNEIKSLQKQTIHTSQHFKSLRKQSRSTPRTSPPTRNIKKHITTLQLIRKQSRSTSSRTGLQIL